MGDPGVSERRRAVALAGHTGDEPAARQALTDPAPAVRATALGALGRLRSLDDAELLAALGDPHPVVRRRASELAASGGPAMLAALCAALHDADHTVVEAACFALGEAAPPLDPDARRPPGSDDLVRAVVVALGAVARSHDDSLCRETAVAALGSIGDPAGVDSILAAMGDKATVRRRAVPALSPFSGPDFDAAPRATLGDRDWQVRQAAEDLTGAAPEA
ncbi:MAG: HEAT repeat domain-containing protein [Acidimicrobiales bacterium]